MTPASEWRMEWSHIEQQLLHLPTDRVVQLRDVGAEDIAVHVAKAAVEMPAVLTHRARAAASATRFVRAVFDDLESVAIELFPAWLPEAANIREPGGAGLAAVRAIASDRAAHSSHFGPFLSDLAVLALSGARSTTRRFPPETRAVGLARVIAESFGRDRIVLLVQVPAALSANAEHALAAGAEWLANRGRLGVWLTGAPLVSVDRFANATVSPLPEVAVDRTRLADDPGVIGKPHPGSANEAVLEAALAAHAWAVGRVWNQSYQSHALMNPVRLDLLWPAERCVVELDGPEHCEPLRFEADRQRDVRLQLDGYAVLRFTNARIRHDVDAVVQQISKFIQARRRESLRGQ